MRRWKTNRGTGDIKVRVEELSFFLFLLRSRSQLKIRARNSSAKITKISKTQLAKITRTT